MTSAWREKTVGKPAVFFYTNEICDMGFYQFEPVPQEEIVGINDFIAL